MNPKKNLLGMHFGRLTVIGESAPKNGAIWICSCICGNKKYVRGGNLLAGNVTSCGCLQTEINKKLGKKLAENRVTHGLRKHPIYKLWNNIMTRCYNVNYHRFKDWGGRGITVCEEWHDAPTFIKWAEENGWEQNLQIDREDNDGPYSPDNCRFVTAHINMLNRRNSKRNDKPH